MTVLTDHLRIAVTHYLAGRLPEAHQACQQILARDPGHADALHLTGAIALQNGDYPRAARLARDAITRNGKAAAYHLTLGKALLNLRQWDGAAASFTRALVLEPKSAEAHLCRGTLELERNDIDRAVATFKRAISLNPQRPAAYNALGLALQTQGKLDDALAQFQKAKTVEPAFAEAYLNLGITYELRGDFQNALESYKQALHIRPSYADAYTNLASLCYNNHKLEVAVDFCRDALRLDPGNVTAHLNMGLALRMMGRFKEAAASLECAVALRPDLADAHTGLALIAELNGHFDKSLAHYDRALQALPNHPATLWNRSLAFLRNGKLREGWKDFETRWQNPRLFNSKQRPFPQPQWNGEAIAGALLIWPEQGLGDEIINASMIPDLVGRGIETVIECDARLVSLFRRSWPHVKVLPYANPPSPDIADIAISHQSSGASLAAVLRPDFSSFPARKQFLLADEEKRRGFRARMEDGRKKDLIVGISWASKNDALGTQKSSVLLDWEPILTQKNTRFVDLQYGNTAQARVEIKDRLGVEIVHFSDQDNFADIDGLASLISACDLVITVSNTTAHLAGALGVPVWVMVPTGIGLTWYWFKDRTDSPWYPSARLYRQKEYDDWRPVLKDVAKALKKLPRP